MSSAYELTPLTAGEILERTIALLRRTFRRIGLMFLLLAVPAALLMGVVMDGFFSSLVDLASGNMVPEGAPEVVGALFGWIAFMTVAVAAVLAIELIALVSMQLVVCGEIVGRDIDVREAFELTLGVRLWRAIVQRFLAELASAAIILVPYLVIILVVTARTGAGSIVGAAIALAVALFCVLYLRVRWAFGTTTIAWEDRAALEAFGRSSDLVRGNGWRTFGILALFAIVVAIAVSVLLMPLQLLIFKDIFMAGLAGARNVALQDDVEVLRALSGIGFLYGITVVVASLATTAIKCVYLPVMYFDLRARNGEFGDD